MEVYLLEELFGGDEVYSNILLYIPKADLWLGTTDSYYGHVEDMEFSETFWEVEKEGEEIVLTKLGNL